MIAQFRGNVAALCGAKAAVIAETIWDQLEEQVADNTWEEHYGHAWCRCSLTMMTVINPFLSEHMVRDAVNELIKKKVILKDSFNESKFDRTNWYAFTAYGERMMLEGGEAE